MVSLNYVVFSLPQEFSIQMHVKNQAVLTQNITVVFDTLNLSLVNSGQLKRLRKDAPQPPIVMDTPDMIVAIFPPEPLVVQMGDRRLRLTLQGNYEVGSIPIWNYAVKCTQLILKSRAKIVAYGFNFDVRIEFLDESSFIFLVNRFLREPPRIEQILHGDLKSFAPRFRYTRNETVFDLILEPLDDQYIKAHINVHFGDQNRLPTEAKLRASYLQEFRRFLDVVSQLLET